MELLVSKPKTTSTIMDFMDEITEYLLSKGFERRPEDSLWGEINYKHKELPIAIETNPSSNKRRDWDYQFVFFEIIVCKGNKAESKTHIESRTNIAKTMQNFTEKMKKAGELAVEIATWIDGKMKE